MYDFFECRCVDSSISRMSPSNCESDPQLNFKTTKLQNEPRQRGMNQSNERDNICGKRDPKKRDTEKYGKVERSKWEKQKQDCGKRDKRGKEAGKQFEKREKEDFKRFDKSGRKDRARRHQSQPPAECETDCRRLEEYLCTKLRQHIDQIQNKLQNKECNTGRGNAEERKKKPGAAPRRTESAFSIECEESSHLTQKGKGDRKQRECQKEDMECDDSEMTLCKNKENTTYKSTYDKGKRNRGTNKRSLSCEFDLPRDKPGERKYNRASSCDSDQSFQMHQQERCNSNTTCNIDMEDDSLVSGISSDIVEVDEHCPIHGKHKQVHDQRTEKCGAIPDKCGPKHDKNGRMQDKRTKGKMHDNCCGPAHDKKGSKQNKKCDKNGRRQDECEEMHEKNELKYDKCGYMQDKQCARDEQGEESWGATSDKPPARFSRRNKTPHCPKQVLEQISSDTCALDSNKEPNYTDDYEKGRNIIDNYKKCLDYTGDYKKGPNYTGDYKKGPDYAYDYKKGPNYTDNYKKGPNYTDNCTKCPDYTYDYKKGPDYTYDYKKGPNYSDNYKKCPDYSDNYKKSPDYSDNYKKCPDYSDNCKKSPDYSDNYKKGPNYSDNYKKSPDYSDNCNKCKDDYDKGPNCTDDSHKCRNYAEVFTKGDPCSVGPSKCPARERCAQPGRAKSCNFTESQMKFEEAFETIREVLSDEMNRIHQQCTNCCPPKYINQGRRC